MGSWRSQVNSAVPLPSTRTQLDVFPPEVHTIHTTSTTAAARKAIRGVSFFQASTCFTRRAASCSPKARAAGNRRSIAKDTRDRLYPRFTWSPSWASTASSQRISRSRQNSTQQSQTAAFHQYTARIRQLSSFHHWSPRRR